MSDLKKNPLLIPSILLFLAAIIFAWAVVASRAPLSENSSQVGPQVQAQARPQLPVGTPNPADSLPTLGASAITGKVTAVGTNSVIIQAGGLGGEKVPSATFKIDAKTTVYARGTSKDPVAYKGEMDDFLAKLAYADPNSATVYLAPDPFEHVALQLSDLKPGSVVTVTPRTADSKTAAKIFVSQP